MRLNEWCAAPSCNRILGGMNDGSGYRALIDPAKLGTGMQSPKIRSS